MHAEESDKRERRRRLVVDDPFGIRINGVRDYPEAAARKSVEYRLELFSLFFGERLGSLFMPGFLAKSKYILRRTDDREKIFPVNGADDGVIFSPIVER